MKAIRRRFAMRIRSWGACLKAGNGTEAALLWSAAPIMGPVMGRMAASFTGSTILSSIRFRISISFYHKTGISEAGSGRTGSCRKMTEKDRSAHRWTSQIHTDNICTVIPIRPPIGIWTVFRWKIMPPVWQDRGMDCIFICLSAGRNADTAIFFPWQGWSRTRCRSTGIWRLSGGRACSTRSFWNRIRPGFQRWWSEEARRFCWRKNSLKRCLSCWKCMRPVQMTGSWS